MASKLGEDARQPREHGVTRQQYQEAWRAMRVTQWNVENLDSVLCLPGGMEVFLAFSEREHSEFFGWVNEDNFVRWFAIRRGWTLVSLDDVLLWTDHNISPN